MSSGSTSTDNEAGNGAFGSRAALALGAICTKHPYLVEAAGHTEEWGVAVQRAEILPTQATVQLLAGAAEMSSQVQCDVVRILREVDDRPLGPVAMGFYEEYLPGPPLIEPPTESALKVGGGLDPLSHSVRARDRLVLTGPLTRGAGLLALQVLILLSVTTSVDGLVLPSVLALPAMLSLVFVSSLAPIESSFAQLVAKLRTPDTAAQFEKVRQRRTSAGLPEDHRLSWYQPSEAIHLLPRVRPEVLRSSALADVYERLQRLIELNLGFSLVVSVSTLPNNPVAALLFSCLGGLLLCCRLYLRVSQKAEQEQLYDDLTIGLGLDLEDD